MAACPTWGWDRADHFERSVEGPTLHCGFTSERGPVRPFDRPVDSNRTAELDTDAVVATTSTDSTRSSGSIHYWTGFV